MLWFLGLLLFSTTSRRLSRDDDDDYIFQILRETSSKSSSFQRRRFPDDSSWVSRRKTLGRWNNASSPSQGTFVGRKRCCFRVIGGFGGLRARAFIIYRGGRSHHQTRKKKIYPLEFRVLDFSSSFLSHRVIVLLRRHKKKPPSSSSWCARRARGN